MVQHEIPPVFDENSRVLVLGSFPSVQSRNCLLYTSLCIAVQIDIAGEGGAAEL